MAIVLITISKKYRRVGTKLKAVVKVLKYAESVARKCSIKKGVPINFAKFTGKQFWRSLFFKNIAGLGLQLY